MIQSTDLQITFSPDEGIQAFNPILDAQLLKVNKPESVFIKNKLITDFKLISNITSPIVDKLLGKGQQIYIIMQSFLLQKECSYTVYEKFPNTIVTNVAYKNISKESIVITSYINSEISFDYGVDATLNKPYYAYQGSSSEDRHDWIRGLSNGFTQQNFMGMNNSDYGGGTPVVDVWNKTGGIAIGHLLLEQREISLPLEIKNNIAHMSIECNEQQTLEKNERFETLPTFITFHNGDCFQPLMNYRSMLVDLGLDFQPFSDSAYESTWCAWGYERDFELKQIYEAIPKVKELGFKWVCLDDGYQLEEGDLELDPIKFPNGDQDMRDFVDHVHGEGLNAQLWWVPLAVDPKAKLYEKHPEWLLLDEDGNKQDITWWDCYTLCPAYQPVIDDLRAQLKRIFVDWNYDGLKIDGQHLNSAKQCHNPKHQHSDPYDSVRGMTDVMKMIFDVAREYKPNATVMYCPCGCSYSIFTMPNYNVPVASDPESSFQVRSKGKVFKALMGRNAPYHGDHVELSDNEDDFASTVGIGGIIGTKFTWPVGSMKHSVLRPDLENPFALECNIEKFYKDWLKLYQERELAKGEYRGELYSYGFDFPEAHVIYKDDTLYFSFYQDDGLFSGEVNFKGLEDGPTYKVYDYVNKQQLGTVTSKSPILNINFNRSLLVELTKIT